MYIYKLLGWVFYSLTCNVSCEVALPTDRMAKRDTAFGHSFAHKAE